MSYVWTSDGNLEGNNQEGSTKVLRFLQWCNWRLHSSGTWCCITGWSDPGISRQHSVLIFNSQNVQKEMFQHLKIRTLCSLRTLESDYPVTQHRVPGQNSHRCIKVRMSHLNNVNLLYQHFTVNIMVNVELYLCLTFKQPMFTYVNTH